MTPTGDMAARNLVMFVRDLRAAGFDVSTQTTRELVQAGQLVGLHRSDEVREAFRAVVTTKNGQRVAFDEAFGRFFSGQTVISLDDVVENISRRSSAYHPPRIGVSDAGGGEDQQSAAEMPEVVGASSSERLMDVDFADLDKAEAVAVEQMLAALTWSPSTFRSRRRKPATAGSVPHLRRTMRLMTSPQGDLMPLAFTERRPRERPLVILADISGSMERYSEMLLHFIHGAQYRFGTVESFVFATRLTRITRQLRRRSPSDALEQVAKVVHDWSGGTRIGESIGVFNREWSRRVGGGRPIALIISDGWDTGEPSHLSLEMKRLSRSMHAVIWLNPLAGREGFAPEARGMAAALPYVDDLLAGGTARNLIDLVDLLSSATVGRRSVAAQ